MGRLLRALLLAAAATGTAYIAIYLRGQSERPAPERRLSRAAHEEEFTPEEQDRILRELSGLT